MVSILKFETGLATFMQEVPEKDIPDLTDYNPYKKEFRTERYIEYPTLNSRHFIKDFLQKNPGACIYNTITHRPPKGAHQILLRGEPFTDVFGLYVYMFSTFALDQRSDVDLRFNANQYPYDIIDPELGFILTLEQQL